MQYMLLEDVIRKSCPEIGSDMGAQKKDGFFQSKVGVHFQSKVSFLTGRYISNYEQCGARGGTSWYQLAPLTSSIFLRPAVVS